MRSKHVYSDIYYCAWGATIHDSSSALAAASFWRFSVRDRESRLRQIFLFASCAAVTGRESFRWSAACFFSPSGPPNWRLRLVTRALEFLMRIRSVSSRAWASSIDRRTTSNSIASSLVSVALDNAGGGMTGFRYVPLRAWMATWAREIWSRLAYRLCLNAMCWRRFFSLRSRCSSGVYIRLPRCLERPRTDGGGGGGNTGTRSIMDRNVNCHRTGIPLRRLEPGWDFGETCERGPNLCTSWAASIRATRKRISSACFWRRISAAFLACARNRDDLGSMLDRSKFSGLRKWVGWVSCTNVRGTRKIKITLKYRGPVNTSRTARVLFSEKIVRGWREITGYTRLSDSCGIFCKLGDSCWKISKLMCDDNSYDAPLAEDVIISGSLQCIEPGMIATFTTEVAVPNVTAETGGECKLADVKNLHASTWGGTTVDPAAVGRLHEEFIAWQKSRSKKDALRGRADPHKTGVEVTCTKTEPEVYEIEKLIGHMWSKKQCGHYRIKYEVKWAKYDATTYEPLENIPSNQAGCACVRAYNIANVEYVCKYCGHQRAFSSASGLKNHVMGCRFRAGRILSA